MITFVQRHDSDSLSQFNADARGQSDYGKIGITFVMMLIAVALVGVWMIRGFSHFA